MKKPIHQHIYSNMHTVFGKLRRLFLGFKELLSGSNSVFQNFKISIWASHHLPPHPHLSHHSPTFPITPPPFPPPFLWERRLSRLRLGRSQPLVTTDTPGEKTSPEKSRKVVAETRNFAESLPRSSRGAIAFF
jgi:hypothetical protein